MKMPFVGNKRIFAFENSSKKALNSVGAWNSENKCDRYKANEAIAF